MAVLQEHLQFFRQMFRVPGFFGNNVATLGVQEIRPKRGQVMPKDFNFKDFTSLLLVRGVKNVDTFDFFDKTAKIKFDFNNKIPSKYYEKYDTFIDIGSLEHIFDTRQAMENCLKMVKVGGLYVLHTPVQGYFRDGFHTFNPDALVGALKVNGFDILYEKYCTMKGTEMEDPQYGRDVNIWVVARKTKKMKDFKIPQQEWWAETLERDWSVPWRMRQKKEKSLLEKIMLKLKIIWYASGLV